MRPPPRCSPSSPRSPRPTSRARSPTSTPSSSTTCAWPCGAPARSCASSRGCRSPSELAHVRDELKWIQALTGPVRDLDVQLLGWDELIAPLASERAADLEPLRTLLERRRAREFARLRRSCAAPRFAAALAAWRALATTAPADDRGPGRRTPIDVLAADRIRRVYRRMVRDGAQDRRRQPAGGAARPAQARQGAALPARDVRRPVRAEGRQADGLDAQAAPGRARRLPGHARCRASCCAPSRDELAAEPGGPPR